MVTLSHWLGRNADYDFTRLGLTAQEAEMFFQIISKVKDDLFEDEGEEESVIGALENVMMKLQTLNGQSWESFSHYFKWASSLLDLYTPFLSVDATTFIKAKIKPGPLTL